MINKPFYILGDTHGGWDRLFERIDFYGVDYCVLVHVGDIGIGFKSPEKQNREIEIINDRFKKRGIEFVGIRGNHDDPDYFNGQVKLSHFWLAPDYTRLNINGEEILLAGGAVSIDRRVRVPNMSWWDDEEFILKPELAGPCDVLITHSPPYWNGPFDKSGISGWCAKDPTLWDECKAERIAISKLIELCAAKKHYCGHFHEFYQVEHGGCLSRILEEYEIVEHRP